MNTMHALLWEHWRQSRAWVVGIAGVLTLIVCGTTLFRSSIYRGDAWLFELLVWGPTLFTLGLLFVSQHIRDIRLNFPRHAFNLPCRTGPIILSHLLYKSIIALILGLTVGVFHTVLAQSLGDKPSYSITGPALILLALVAQVQALVVLQAALGTMGALCLSAALVGVTAWACLSETVGLFSATEFPIRGILLLYTVLGWTTCFLFGTQARYGICFHRTLWASPTPPKLISTMIGIRGDWISRSPLRAQCWYEWRCLYMGLPLAALAAVAAAMAVIPFAPEYGIPLLFIFPIYLTGFTAIPFGFIGPRISKMERHFVFGGMPIHTRSDAKLLTAGIAVSASTAIALSAAYIAAPLGPYSPTGAPLTDLLLIFLKVTALQWIVLTAAPFIVASFGLFLVCFLFVHMPLVYFFGPDLSAPIPLFLHLVALAIAVPCAIKVFRKADIPFPWELSLVALCAVPRIPLYFGWMAFGPFPSPSGLDSSSPRCYSWRASAMPSGWN